MGALPDWVNGDWGWIADVDAWAAALEGFFANTEARRTEYRSLSNRVRARCAPEAVAEAHEAVYRTLVC